LPKSRKLLYAERSSIINITTNAIETDFADLKQLKKLNINTSAKKATHGIAATVLKLCGDSIVKKPAHINIINDVVKKK
jgi:hypothetical protein